MIASCTTSPMVMIMVFTMTHARLPILDTCDSNEKYVECARDLPCQASCQEPTGTPCPRMCGWKPCECKDGFIRDSNLTCVPVGQCSTISILAFVKKGFLRASRKNSTCVEQKQCPQIQLTTQPACDDNEIFDSCANPCPPTCDEPDRAPCPTLRCSGGCVCAQGFFGANSSSGSPCVTCD